MDSVLKVACQQCGAALPPGARYCRDCGLRQPARTSAPSGVAAGTQNAPGRPCPACASLLPAGARYCWDCGHAVAPAEAQEYDQKRKVAAVALETLGILSAEEMPKTPGVPGAAAAPQTGAPFVPDAPAGPQIGAPFVPGAPAGPQTGTPFVPSAPAAPQTGTPFVPSAPAGPQTGIIPQPPGVSSGGGKLGKPGKKKSSPHASGAPGFRILTVPHIVIFSLVIVLIVGTGAVVIAAPNLLPGGKSGASATNTPGPTPTSTPIIASAATVTITPTSQQQNNTFTIDAVTGTPTAQQVQARQLSATTQTYSKTVNATGQGMTSGTSATGTVTLEENAEVSPITVTAGSVYDNNDCVSPPCVPIQLVVDQTVTLTCCGQVPGVPAHVQEVGTIGNIASQVFRYINGASSLLIWNDSNLTGGTDPQPYTYVQQSDINNAANSLISANQPDPQQVLQPQVKSNERFAGTPHCTPNVSSNHPAGAQVSQVTIRVNFTCTGEVYDYDGGLALAAQQLANQAANNLGMAFALSGQIKTTLNTVTPGSGGTVMLSITAIGVWVYQFSSIRQSALASLIAGKSPQAAKQMLEVQMGVSQVTIQLSDANAQVLPTNPAFITIVVQMVPGA